ncbi:MAG TPA: type II toxin-antitoxin system CcdA family antitoxin [Sphingomonas sp.]|nr:type II toxin-antitoxin system CcdA family antitoxin [Sphingomonas sp.]
MRMSNEPRAKASRATGARRAANLSLDAGHLAEARALGINISQACEAGLVRQIRVERARRWREENQAAIQSSNAFVEANGLPLRAKRLF